MASRAEILNTKQSDVNGGILDSKIYSNVQDGVVERTKLLVVQKFD